MPGLAVSYVGSKDDVIAHLTGQRDALASDAAAPRLGQQAKARLDGRIAGLDEAIEVLTQWTGPDGTAH